MRIAWAIRADVSSLTMGQTLTKERVEDHESRLRKLEADSR